MGVRHSLGTHAVPQFTQGTVLSTGLSGQFKPAGTPTPSNKLAQCHLDSNPGLQGPSPSHLPRSKSYLQHSVNGGNFL